MVFVESISVSILIVAGLSGLADAQGPVPSYGQCGGLNLPNGQDAAMLSCQPGYQCQKINPYYWQCVPSNQPPQGGQKAAYEQCGGKNLPNGSDSAMYPCTSGYSCAKINEWYWQCTPYQGSPTPPASPPVSPPYPPANPPGPPANPPPPSPPSGKTAGNYEQCGGLNLPDGKDAAMYGCSAGYKCQKQNPYYWQCVPGNDPPQPGQKGQYEQCGGKNLPSGKDAAMYSCTPGYSCTRANEWYWQCTPSSKNVMVPFNMFNAQYSSSSNSNPTQNYGQCGGLNLPNGQDAAMYSCNAGYQCQKQNPYYWQCVPSNQPPQGNQKGQWEQCGGVNLPNGSDGALYSCTAGWKCARRNAYYWQCIPESQNLRSGF